MSVMTLEGVVEHGQIQLPPNIHLPDNTKVYIVIPDTRIERTVHISTPRFVHPEQVKELQMEVIEAPTDAEV